MCALWFSVVIRCCFGCCSPFRRRATVAVRYKRRAEGQPGRSQRALVQHPSSEDARRRWGTRAKQETLAIAQIASPNNEAVLFRMEFFFTARREPERTCLRRPAGEFGVNFHHVRRPELVGQNTGSGADRIRGVFESLAANRPIVLFLTSIHSIGSRKQEQGHGTGFLRRRPRSTPLWLRN